MLSLNLTTPQDKQAEIAERFRRLRLMSNLRRESVAEMSGVPAPSIKRFELTGEISLRSLLKLAHVLGALDTVDGLFVVSRSLSSLDEIEAMEKKKGEPKRKRARK